MYLKSAYMIVGSCVNLSTYRRLSVGLRDIVETLTGMQVLSVNSYEYLRVPVETGLKTITNAYFAFKCVNFADFG